MPWRVARFAQRWNEIEAWHAYYDIFVRHAFGNFRDVMREVAYSPMMAQYLTFLQNKAQAYTGSYPDENFAREIMQLFTIGLWELNPDGTQKLDDAGQPRYTYTNDDIVTLSRAWTGHDYQKRRRNVENPDGHEEGTKNTIDPMRLLPQWRDPFPKLGLQGGYIGDGYPLCVDAPEHAYLRRGARFSYLGQTPSWHPIWTSYDNAALELSDISSPLFQALCDAAAPPVDGSEARPQCRLQSTVTLAETLPCTGVECAVDAPRLFFVTAGNVSAYYEWQREACVEFPFYANAKVVTYTSNGPTLRPQCADPRLPQAGSCCRTTGGDIRAKCHYDTEVMTYATNQARCASTESTLAEAPSSFTFGTAGAVCASSADNINWWCNTKGGGIRHWTSESCRLQVQVDSIGWLRIVHAPAGEPMRKEGGDRPSFQKDNENLFRVAWDDHAFPTATTGCTAADGASTACVVDGITCLCDVEVRSTRLFDAHPDSAATVLEAARIGAWCPNASGVDAYSRLDGGGGDVEVFMSTSNPGGGGFNEDTILRIRASGKCFANRRSMVYIRRALGGHSAPPAFQFRNAPHFVSFLMPTHIDAAHETEATLDHYFHHPNTAPFVAYRLIQRFVSSNPSPRYVLAVATAFRTGRHDGDTYSGQYGDLGAAIAALFLDREARAMTLDADPHHGVLREPLLKVHHFLRAMEYVSRDGREIALENIHNVRRGLLRLAAPDARDHASPSWAAPPRRPRRP